MGDISQPLIIGVSMDGIDDACLNSERIIQYLGHGCEAVGGTAGVGNNFVLRLQIVIIHTDNHGVINLILGRDGKNNPTGTGGKVALQLFLLPKNTGSFHDHINAHIIPGELGRIGTRKQGNCMVGSF